MLPLKEAFVRGYQRGAMHDGGRGNEAISGILVQRYEIGSEDGDVAVYRPLNQASSQQLRAPGRGRFRVTSVGSSLAITRRRIRLLGPCECRGPVYKDSDEIKWYLTPLVQTPLNMRDQKCAQQRPRNGIGSQKALAMATAQRLVQCFQIFKESQRRISGYSADKSTV